GSAVARIETVAEAASRRARQPLGELDGRLVRAAGEEHVLQLSQLVRERGVDARVGMPEEIHPPRADRVEIPPAVEIVEPAPGAARHRNQRQDFVMLHLGARMPYRAQ